jgi:uncharacterized membrane protein YfcA
LGGQIEIMYAWLDETCGAEGWGTGPAGLIGVLNDAIAFYFDNAAFAHAFVARLCCGYRVEAVEGAFALRNDTPPLRRGASVHKTPQGTHTGQAGFMTLFGWAGLAGTTFAAALLQAVSGFGFAVLAVPLYLLLVDPAQAVQLAIILSTALSFAVVSGLRRTVAPALLLRLGIGSLAGLPIGLFSFRYADRLLVRLVVGAAILAFGVMMAGFRFRGGRPWARFGRTQTRDLAAGAAAGVATALVGMAGPPVLIYLLLAGTAAQTVRATLLAFFALSYGATLASHAATVGIPGPTWVAAGILAPIALLGGLVGRPIGDRIGSDGFALLAIALLTAAGLYTVVAAGVGLVAREP